MEPRLCHLDAAVGRSIPCPGESCSFWEDENCRIEPLGTELAHDACLVTVLIGLRAERARHAPDHGIRDFHPPGLV
jgi:hypothetical protein